MKNRMTTFILFTISFLLFSGCSDFQETESGTPSLPNATGTLDTSFGTNGVAYNAAPAILTNSFGWDGSIYNGNFIISGNIHVTGVTELADVGSWRFDVNGIQDLGYSDGTGYYHKDLGSAGTDYTFGSDVDSSGRLVVTALDNATSEAYIMRITSDGTTDTSFGNSSGMEKITDPGNTPYLYSLTIDTDGTIYVTGTVVTPGQNEMKLWRLTADGSHDADFTYSTAFEQRGFDMHIDSVGDIFVVGSSQNFDGDDWNVIVWKVKKDLSGLDSSFGTNGYSRIDIGGYPSGGSDIIQNPSTGNLYVTGSITDIGSKMYLLCLTAQGAVCPGFDKDSSIHLAGGTTSKGYKIALDAYGKILVVGDAENSNGDRGIGLWRLNANGTLDTTFGSGGYIVYHSGGVHVDSGMFIMLGSDNSIYIGGGILSDRVGLLKYK
jgi:uncharacterized delta-60 repeat protein